MTLVTLIRRLVLLSVFAVITSLAAAKTPSSALLVVSRSAGEHALQIADPLTMKVVGSMPIGGGGFPHEVAVSNDGKLAFVTNNSNKMSGSSEIPHGNYISVFDLAARKELRRI